MSPQEKLILNHADQSITGIMLVISEDLKVLSAELETSPRNDALRSVISDLEQQNSDLLDVSKNMQKLIQK